MAAATPPQRTHLPRKHRTALAGRAESRANPGKVPSRPKKTHTYSGSEPTTSPGAGSEGRHHAPMLPLHPSTPQQHTDPPTATGSTALTTLTLENWSQVLKLLQAPRGLGHRFQTTTPAGTPMVGSCPMAPQAPRPQLPSHKQPSESTMSPS